MGIDDSALVTAQCTRASKAVLRRVPQSTLWNLQVTVELQVTAHLSPRSTLEFHNLHFERAMRYSSSAIYMSSYNICLKVPNGLQGATFGIQERMNR